MSIFLTLIVIWFVTLMFYIFARDKHNWAGAMVIICILISLYEFTGGKYLLTGIWVFNSLIWWNTRKKRLLLKKFMDEQKEKGNGEFPGSEEL